MSHLLQNLAGPSSGPPPTISSPLPRASTRLGGPGSSTRSRRAGDPGLRRHRPRRLGTAAGRGRRRPGAARARLGGRPRGALPLRLPAGHPHHDHRAGARRRAPPRRRVERHPAPTRRDLLGLIGDRALGDRRCRRRRCLRGRRSRPRRGRPGPGGSASSSEVSGLKISSLRTPISVNATVVPVRPARSFTGPDERHSPARAPARRRARHATPGGAGLSRRASPISVKTSPSGEVAAVADAGAQTVEDRAADRSGTPAAPRVWGRVVADEVMAAGGVIGPPGTRRGGRGPGRAFSIRAGQWQRGDQPLPPAARGARCWMRPIALGQRWPRARAAGSRPAYIDRFVAGSVCT